MNILRKIIFTAFAFVTIQMLSAQVFITGTVTDAGKGEPLTGANVYVMNAENRSLGGCIVDSNGEYRLRIPMVDNLTIVYSFVGFKTKTVKYTGQKKIDIKLEEDGRVIGMVEVTAQKVERNALGQSPRERVSAVQKVTLEGIETAGVTNVTEALQGALANVDILTGADPGSGSSIRIRGTSSLNANSNPLFVLDGVPMPVDVSSDFNFATANSDDYSQLLNISPMDILSIEVLKDAAATAVWGRKERMVCCLLPQKKALKVVCRLPTQANTNSERRKFNSHAQCEPIYFDDTGCNMEFGKRHRPGNK
jgi:hypothetical protein